MNEETKQRSELETVRNLIESGYTFDSSLEGSRANFNTMLKSQRHHADSLSRKGYTVYFDVFEWIEDIPGKAWCPGVKFSVWTK